MIYSINDDIILFLMVNYENLFCLQAALIKTEMEYCQNISKAFMSKGG
jgi:hypothetical protein